MTLRENRIADEVEKTLQAYSHDPVLEPNPFLLSRIQSALAENSSAEARGAAARILAGVSFMVVIILLNLMTLSHSLTARHQESLRQQLIQQLETELHFDQTETIF
jgi:hypothetical protein